MPTHKEGFLAREHTLQPKDWLGYQLSFLFGEYCDHGGEIPDKDGILTFVDMRIPKNPRFLPIDIKDWRRQVYESSLPLSKGEQRRMHQAVAQMDNWFSRLKQSLEVSMPQYIGVFEPDNLRDVTRNPDKLDQILAPLSPGTTVTRLAELAENVWLPYLSPGQRIGSVLWRFGPKHFDKFINTGVLTAMRNRRIRLEGSRIIDKTWELQTKIQGLGSSEGNSQIDFHGKILSDVHTYFDLSKIISAAVLAYYHNLITVRQIVNGFVDEYRQDNPHALAQACWQYAWEQCRLRALDAGACGKNAGQKTVPLGSAQVEDIEDIDIRHAKVMLVNPAGQIALVPVDLWNNPQQIQGWVADFLAQRPESQSQTGFKFSLWQYLQMSGSGSGIQIDDRYNMLDLVNSDGSKNTWPDAFKDTLAVISVGDQPEAVRTLALNCSHMIHFQTKPISIESGTLQVEYGRSIVTHKITDGMPHQRLLAAIIGRMNMYLHREVDGGIVQAGQPEFSIPKMNMRIAPNADLELGRRIAADMYWQGPRMEVRLSTDLGADFAAACKHFSSLTSKETERRAWQYAEVWVDEHISYKDLWFWAHTLGMKKGLLWDIKGVRDMIVKCVAVKSESIRDLSKITTAYATALIQDIIVSLYGMLPSMQMCVEAQPMSPFIMGRMGAALIVLDQELAQAWNWAYRAGEFDNQNYHQAIWYFHEVLARLAIQVRSGVAQVGIGRGLITSTISVFDPDLQGRMRSLTGFLPGLFGVPASPEIIAGSAMQSALVLPKGISWLNPELTLTEALYADSGLHASGIFQTTKEANQGEGMQCGTMWEYSHTAWTKMMRQKPNLPKYSETEFMTIAQTIPENHLLIVWLADPQRRTWLVDNICQIKDDDAIKDFFFLKGTKAQVRDYLTNQSDQKQIQNLLLASLHKSDKFRQAVFQIYTAYVKYLDQLPEEEQAETQSLPDMVPMHAEISLTEPMILKVLAGYRKHVLELVSTPQIAAEIAQHSQLTIDFTSQNNLDKLWRQIWISSGPVHAQAFLASIDEKIFTRYVMYAYRCSPLLQKALEPVLNTIGQEVLADFIRVRDLLIKFLNAEPNIGTSYLGNAADSYRKQLKSKCDRAIRNNQYPMRSFWDTDTKTSITNALEQSIRNLNLDI